MNTFAVKQIYTIPTRAAIWLLACLFLLPAPESYSQPIAQPNAYYVNVAAGPEYKRGKFHQFFFGKNRRKEWTTPVHVPIVLFDTLNGGTVVVKKGGGNESKTLQLKAPDGKMYALRSVNKSRRAVTPKLLRGTGVGNIIQDGVSMSYPYGCMVLPGLLRAANIPHATPALYYVPEQPALGEHNARYGNDLYFIEERPDGNWSDHPQMGGFSDFISSSKLLKKIQEDNDIDFDQQAYIKARLVDIMVGDWDRQPDNWRWGNKTDDKNFYSPLPRDRDQVFFTRNGKVYNVLIPISRYHFMQNFTGNVKNIKKLTKQDRAWDQLMTNNVSLEQWKTAAAELQQTLTDTAIALAVQGLPKEIYAISGKELTEKIIQRRNNLHQYAEQFYKVLAANVEINGSEKAEVFQIEKQTSNALRVNIYRVKDGKKETTPYFSQLYLPQYTQTISINGGEGDDVFQLPENYKGIRIISNKGKSANPVFDRDDD